MVIINSIEDLHNHMDKLPLEVVIDINKRLTDWLASGGKHEDPYIKQQFRYAQNILNRRE